MQILNIAGYKFIALKELASLREAFQKECLQLELKGTILLSVEGININLSGPNEKVEAFLDFLKNNSYFDDISFHKSYSENYSFKKLKVKIKKEIITFRNHPINVIPKQAASISPQTLKTWLDEQRDIILLDTRNDYEVRFGTFEKAQNLQIADFSEFPESLPNLEKKPIVTFCTGGIRCEKAALYMLNQGYSEVYQLEGGILGYFQKERDAHYQGECFVFDDRISVDGQLKETPTRQCQECQGPIYPEQLAGSSQSCEKCAMKTIEL